MAGLGDFHRPRTYLTSAAFVLRPKTENAHSPCFMWKCRGIFTYFVKWCTIISLVAKKELVDYDGRH